MQTTHTIHLQDARRMTPLAGESIDLVVTSPPYPMIEMWDEVFGRQDPQIKAALNRSNGPEAFERMHRVLDPVWRECWRVLKPGGIACINIGDATRTINGDFRLYANHARILSCMLDLGFSALPDILWRKQTNAPNKFMGSGMLPAGAYVTLEHEYILVLRKGEKRAFATEEDRRRRRESAYFWEERNLWFSDVWFDIKGSRQELGARDTRLRSGAFPFELAYRLINMYAAKGDTVLDPFLGLGTTTAAAMAAGRSSVGFEIDTHLLETIQAIPGMIVDVANQVITGRLERHLAFCAERQRTHGALKHVNRPYGFPVVTAQERDLLLNALLNVEESGPNRFEVRYADAPQQRWAQDLPAQPVQARKARAGKSPRMTPRDDSRQLELFAGRGRKTG